MRAKTIGSVMGSLGLLLGAGAAWGAAQDDSAGNKTLVGGQASTERGCRDAGVTVAFKTSSSDLDQNARGALDGVATWMKGDEKRTLHLEGFADTTGDSTANLVLSAHRADAVKSYLVEQGVASERVMTVGRGEEIDHLPANGRAVTFLACEAEGPGPAVAGAETPPVTPVEPVQPVEVTPMPAPAPAPRWGRGFGWALMAGGSYQDFTNDTMRSVTNGAGGWAARFVGGTNSYIGFEAGYVGSARAIQTLGVTANSPTLVANGFEGNIRVNIPIRKGPHLLEPYGYTGLGYSRYNISNYNSNTNALSSFAQNDDVMTVPVGGGFAYAYKAFIADVRAGWTGTYYQDLLAPSNGDSNGALNHWDFGGQVGFMF